MGDNAHRSDAVTGPAHSPRTGLVPGTHHRTQERTKRVPGSTAASGDLMRLFVAIAPPSAVLDELDALVEPLRARRPDLRWTNREAWHVTLAFLGQVDEAAAARLLPRLERAARRHQQVRLAFEGAGAFPSATRANVLWSGLSGDRGALARLAESVAAGARRAGAPPPDKGRRFRPHRCPGLACVAASSPAWHTGAAAPCPAGCGPGECGPRSTPVPGSRPARRRAR